MPAQLDLKTVFKPDNARLQVAQNVARPNGSQDVGVSPGLFKDRMSIHTLETSPMKPQPCLS
jgi:hypothetical protein